MKKKEYLESIKKLNQWSDAYYNHTPIATDQEYDTLYHQVQEYEANNQPSPNSPTQRVGATTVSKIEHRVRMWSMQDIFTLDDLTKWCHNYPFEYYVMPKYDGCSLNLEYQDGILISALTRGDGVAGESVLYNADFIQGVPKVIKHKGTIEIRGEVVIAKSDFEEINNLRLDQNLPVYSNPRNLASGSLRMKEDISDRHLQFVPWGIGYNDLDIAEYSNILSFLKDNGFRYEDNAWIAHGPTEVLNHVNRLTVLRDTLPFQLDGVVVRVNSVKVLEDFGYTSKFPKAMVAYKFQAQEAVTILKDVKWQVGRTGKVTPVGILDPVNIDGVVVSNVTLHNPDYITSMGLQLNDHVVIIRSGDVIPKLTQVFTDRATDREPIPVPTLCPSCHSPLSRDGAYLKCYNLSCRDRVVNSILHYGSRKACSIEGLGEAVVNDLYSRGMIRRLRDIYSLDASKMLLLDGYGETKVHKLLRAIESTKGIPYYKFLFALGIEGLGESVSKTLARYGRAIFEDRTLLKTTDHPGIAKVIESINSLTDDERQEILELMDIVQPTIVTKSAVKANLAVSGSLSVSRIKYISKMEELGFEVTAVVTKNTEYLIVGEDPSETKLAKAKKYNIPVMTEQEFESRLDQF